MNSLSTKARPAVHDLTTGQKEQTTSFTHASSMPKTEKWGRQCRSLEKYCS